jgi:hypothetical protein
MAWRQVSKSFAVNVYRVSPFSSGVAPTPVHTAGYVKDTPPPDTANTLRVPYCALVMLCVPKAEIEIVPISSVHPGVSVDVDRSLRTLPNNGREMSYTSENEMPPQLAVTPVEYVATVASVTHQAS